MENQKYREMLFNSESCPTPELLWDYSHGKATVSTTLELEKHIAHCVLCAGAVEGFATMASPESLKHVAIKNPYSAPNYFVSLVKVTLAVLGLISILWWWNSMESANTLEGDSIIVDSTELPHVNVNAELKYVEGEKKESEIVQALESNVLENIELESISTNRWKDELFTIEKKGIVLAGRNQVKLEIVNRPLTPIIYIYNLKVMDFTKKYGPLDLPFEVPSNLHPRYANPNEKGTDHIFTEEDTVYYRDLLESAMLNFSQGFYKQTAEQLSIILKRNPNDDNALFYGGLSQMEMDNWKESISLLKKLSVQNESAFSEEANWHLALAYLKDNSIKEGQECLLRIAEGNGFYAIQAKELLRK